MLRNQILYRNSTSGSNADSKGQKYSTRTTDLHNREKLKPYPDRYPLNSDSIGIEIVGNYDTKTKAYESVGELQNQSLQ